METVDKRYGKILKGHTAPYGAFVGASAELKQAYYNHGYLRDEDMPEIPRPPFEYVECDNPEEALYKKDVARVVGEVLGSITPRERTVLCMRFGIGTRNDIDLTLEEVGRAFDVTRERIRQIEVKAIRKMKHPSRTDVFKELLGWYQTTSAKKAEEESARTRWEKERARAEEQREAQAQARIARDRATFKQRREVEEKIYKADRELRKKWEEIKPMVSDVEWVEHLRTADPAMYQELKYIVGDIWGKNARIVWEMFAEKEKSYERRNKKRLAQEASQRGIREDTQ